MRPARLPQSTTTWGETTKLTPFARTDLERHEQNSKAFSVLSSRTPAHRPALVIYDTSRGGMHLPGNPKKPGCCPAAIGLRATPFERLICQPPGEQHRCRRKLSFVFKYLRSRSG